MLKIRAVATVSIVTWVLLSLPALAREIKVGVVQRFGEKPSDRLTLQAAPGDTLNLQFQTNGRPEVVTASTAVVEIVSEAVPQPVWEEKLVLKQVGTFETAEDYANQMRSQGIATEVAQPGRWQVWAKRDVYNTPLLRRLLLQSLQAKGDQFAFLESKVLSQVPRAVLVVNGVRYARNEIEITSQQGVVIVGVGGGDRTIYPGRLRLQPNAHGDYALVNHVNIEDYLRGVVPHEIGPNAPYNAVVAQTIIARTYALRNLRRFVADGYELCATVHCQVYKGWNGTIASADRAIAATSGLVLVHNNELVDGLYSSATGGITSFFSDVWNGPDRPYLTPVLDTTQPLWNLQARPLNDENNFRAFINIRQGWNETGIGQARWRIQATLPEIITELKDYLQRNKHPLANFNRISQIQVTKRSTSGRVLTVVVTTDLGPIEIHKNEIRTAFEPPLSTLFYLEPILNGDQTIAGYAFIGGGFGHGVGMGQTGSYRLADLGYTGEQILLFYYPGTQIQPLSDQITLWREPVLP